MFRIADGLGRGEKFETFRLAISRHITYIDTGEADLEITEISPLNAERDRSPPWIDNFEELDHTVAIAVRPFGRSGLSRRPVPRRPSTHGAGRAWP